MIYSRKNYYATHLDTRLKTTSNEPSFKDDLLALFEESIPAFEKCKGDRKNYLSLDYVGYKSCELKNDKLLFPMFKAVVNILESDIMWRQMCAFNRERGLEHWIFIPTLDYKKLLKIYEDDEEFSHVKNIELLNKLINP